MKIHLPMFKGINQKYHLPLWQEAVKNMRWDITNDHAQADVIVIWGVTPIDPLEYGIANKKPVLVLDFPYWNRGGKNRDGNEFYKVSLYGQHPTPFILKEAHDKSRYKATGGMPIMPWRTGGSKIVFAGTGQKASRQFGHEPGGWEQKIVELVRAQTDMPIIYRPKPGQNARPIPGTIFDDGSTPMEKVMSDAALVICHHGNPAVTALAMGIPIFMNGHIGVASHFASFAFDKINEPVRPDEVHGVSRAQFFYNLAHWQWSVSEIRNGTVFREYLKRGLLS